MISPLGVRTEVAVKVLHRDLDPAGQATERLRDEARLLGLLNHPAILKVQDLVILDGRVALVAEYVDGADLDACYRHRTDPIPPGAALQVLSRVADALRAAWERPGPAGAPLRMTHRDLKPANIRVGRHGEVKLLDFGIAKARLDDREARTRRGDVVGSFQYMAPERFVEEDCETTAVDVYGLGCTLYEVVARKGLFRGMNAQLLFGLSRDPERRAAIVERGVADLDARLAALIQELIDIEPSRRPALESLPARLEDLADQLGGPNLSRWCRAHVWSEPVETQGELSGRILTDSPLPPPRRPWLVWAAAAGGLGVAGTAGAAVLTALIVAAAVLALPTMWGPERATSEDAAEPVPDGIEETRDPAPEAPVDEEPPPGGAPASPDPPPLGDGGPVADPTPLDPTVAEPPVAGSPTGCDDLVALEPAALLGRLAPADLACLVGRLHDPGERQTARERVGRVVLNDAIARCAQGSCSDYEREQRYFFAEVDQSDPDMCLAFATHLAKSTSDAARVEALSVAQRALENKAVWEGPEFIHKVDQLQQLMARVAYARWSDQPRNEKLRVRARDLAIEWMNTRRQIGKDSTPALQLCASIEGSEAGCVNRGSDLPPKVQVTFVSVPIGAGLIIDGTPHGPAPQTVLLEPGKHTIGFDGDARDGAREIDVGSGQAKRWTWRSSTDAWEPAY